MTDVRRRPALLPWSDRGDVWPLVTLGLAVLVANAPYLLHVVSADPRLVASGVSFGGKPTFLPGKAAIDPDHGYVAQALGHRAALDWLHGHVPWWNRFEGAGAPLAAEMQSAALFPLTLLLAFGQGLLFEHVLLELLSGAATYLLLRRLGARPWVACVGGVAFALNGTSAWFQHAPVNPIPFLPLLLLGIEHAHARALRGLRGGWLLVAMSVALSIYAGFIETAYIDGLLAAVWAGCRMVSTPGVARPRLLLKLGLGAAAGVLLALPLLLPFAAYLPDGVIGLHAGHASRLHLGGIAFPGMVLPYSTGPIFATLGAAPAHYVGRFWGNVGGYLITATLPLAMLGLLARRDRVLRIALGGWVVFAGLASFGLAGLPSVLRLLPGMEKVAFYRYAVPTYSLALVLLAALAVEDLLARRVSRRHALVAAVGGVVTVTLAAVLVWPTVAGFPRAHGLRHLAMAATFGGVVAGVLASLIMLVPRRGAILAGVLITLQAVGLFVVPELSAPRPARLDTSAIRVLRTEPLSRFATTGPIAPNYGSYWGVGSVNVNDLPVPKRWAAYVHERLDPRVNPMIFTGGRAGRRGAPSPAAELLAHVDGYRQAGVRFVLARPADDAFRGVAALTPIAHGPTTTVYRLAGTAPYFTADGCAVTTQSWVRAVVRCSKASRLMRRELAIRGWYAHVDGRAATIGVSDIAFESVAVPEGTSNVTFGYSPPHLRLALVGALAGLVLCALPFLPPIRRREPATPTP